MSDVRESTIIIPTYKVMEPNKNPILGTYKGERSYPYPLRDQLSRDKEDVTYKTIELENEYIKVIFLPALGGKIHSAVDKRSGKDIFYTNHVVKPQMVGLTGAWTAGGLEWNCPAVHRPSAMETADIAYRRNADGSASVFIGEINKTSGIRFWVELVLYPGKAYIEQNVFIHNSAEIPVRYTFWSTSAVPETDGMEYRCPFRQIILDESERKKYLWPFHEGMDLRKSREIKPSTAIYGVNVREDFFGTYDEEIKTGLVHVASWQDVPGKDIWAWGSAEQGRMWNRILTDEDGPYVEVQSGNVETQADYRYLEPGKTIGWKEYWFQAYETGPYTYADKTGILTVSLQEQKEDIILEVVLRVNGNMDEAVIKVYGSTQVLYEEKCNLSPVNIKKFQTTLPKQVFASESIKIAVFENGGKRMETLVKEPVSLMEQIYHDKNTEEGNSVSTEVQGSYSAGSEALPVYDLDKAIKGIHSFRYREAEESLEKLRMRDDTDDVLNYYLGLAYFKQKKYKQAESALFYVGTHSVFYSAASGLLGRMAMVRKDYSMAEEYFGKIYSKDPKNSFISVWYAYSLRMQGKTEQAQKVLISCLSADPLNLSALYELASAGGCSFEEVLKEYHILPRLSIEDLLEILKIYHEAEDYHQALNLCNEYCTRYSLLMYHKAYYLAAAGKHSESKQVFKSAENESLDYVFPNKEITMEVLEALNELYHSPKVQYLLGLIYADRGWNGRAAALWDPLNQRLEYSVLSRNLAYLYWKKLNQSAKACSVLERARWYKPFNPEIWIYLNLIYKELGWEDKRKELLSEMLEMKQDHQGIVLTVLHLLNDFKRYDESLEILESYPFRTWEMEFSPEINLRELYQNARIGKALEEIAYQNIPEAVSHLEKVFDYPANTELAETHSMNKYRVYYYLMLCYEALGRLGECLMYSRRIIEQGSPDKNSPEYEYYRKALKKMLELDWLGVPQQ